MASNKLSNFNFSLIKRVAPLNGPFSSNAWNDSMDELVVDLSTLALEWNNKIVTVLNTLPNGSIDVAIDAFDNGLDGKNIWADAGATSLSSDHFWNSVESRPYTVVEILEKLYTYIDDKFAQLEAEIAAI
jgi:hypothetical protein